MNLINSKCNQDNKIFFSGEATTSKYMSEYFLIHFTLIIKFKYFLCKGTVHGGHITGLDAANKIAKLYKV